MDLTDFFFFVFTDNQREKMMTQGDDKERVLQFLQEKTRLFEVVRTIRQMSQEDEDAQYSLIRGAIQSGKSRIIHSLVMYFTMVLNENMVVVVRNFTGDYEQLRHGYECFLEEFKEFLGVEEEDEEEEMDLTELYYIGNVVRSKKKNKLSKHENLCTALGEGGCCVLTLANVDHLRKIIECVELVKDEEEDCPRFHLVIDEVDQLMYAEGDEFSPLFQHMLKEISFCVFGISGTLFENLQDGRFPIHNIFDMRPPPHYKGVADIQFETIEKLEVPAVKSDKPKSFLERDPDMHKFLYASRNHPPVYMGKDKGLHPMILLIKTERFITNQEGLLQTIKDHPVLGESYTVITYNGSQNKVYSPALVGKKMILPVCFKHESTKKSSPEIHVFPNTSIMYILQYLKNNGGVDLFPRIIIIGHGLVGRGINVVSADYQWHLTHMFYRPSADTPVPSLLQSLRLCGIYKDTVPLKCMVEKNVYENIYKGHFLQEDVFYRLKKMDPADKSMSAEDWMEKQVFHKTKIPRRRFLRKGNKFAGKKTDKKSEDKGMDLETFNQHKGMTTVLYPPPRPIFGQSVPNKPLKEMKTGTEVGDEDQTGDLPQKEFERLTDPKKGMFKKWANPSNQSAIARFMREGLDPHRKYTKKEITSLCKEYGVVVSNITQTHHSYGHFIIENKHQYFLHPKLIDTFQKYF